MKCSKYTLRSEQFLSESKCLKKKNGTPILSAPSRDHRILCEHVLALIASSLSILFPFPLVSSLSLLHAPPLLDVLLSLGVLPVGLGIEICSLLDGCGI